MRADWILPENKLLEVTLKELNIDSRMHVRETLTQKTLQISPVDHTIDHIFFLKKKTGIHGVGKSVEQFIITGTHQNVRILIFAVYTRVRIH